VPTPVRKKQATSDWNGESLDRPNWNAKRAKPEENKRPASMLVIQVPYVSSNEPITAARGYCPDIPLIVGKIWFCQAM
jgi:hypothetical protein